MNERSQYRHPSNRRTRSKPAEVDTYYERERLAVVCEIEIGYKRGSKESRTEAVDRALQIQLHAIGVSEHGCYDVRVLSTKTG